MSKCECFKSKIEYSGHLVSRKGFSLMTQIVKVITDLALATITSDIRNTIGLIGYYRKIFPIFSDIIQPLNEFSKKMFLSNGLKSARKV